MENTNLSNLINILSSAKTDKDASSESVPKEILDQYPYGDFPIRYTRSGQEFLRKNSEARYLNPTPQYEEPKTSKSDISTLATLLSLVGTKKKSPSDMLELFSSIIFKDNPEIKNILKLFNTNKQPKIEPLEKFPDANKIKISTLKRVE